MRAWGGSRARVSGGGRASSSSSSSFFLLPSPRLVDFSTQSQLVYYRSLLSSTIVLEQPLCSRSARLRQLHQEVRIESGRDGRGSGAGGQAGATGSAGAPGVWANAAHQSAQSVWRWQLPPSTRLLVGCFSNPQPLFAKPLQLTRLPFSDWRHGKAKLQEWERSFTPWDLSFQTASRPLQFPPLSSLLPLPLALTATSFFIRTPALRSPYLSSTAPSQGAHYASQSAVPPCLLARSSPLQLRPPSVSTS